MAKNMVELADGRQVAAIVNFEVLMQIANRIPKDQLTALSKGNLKDISALFEIFQLMIQAGERREGRECNLTAEDLKRLLSVKDSCILLNILTVQAQSFTNKPVYFRDGKTGKQSGVN